jgi:hypothetical protein
VKNLLGTLGAYGFWFVVLFAMAVVGGIEGGF